MLYKVRCREFEWFDRHFDYYPRSSLRFLSLNTQLVEPSIGAVCGCTDNGSGRSSYVLACLPNKTVWLVYAEKTTHRLLCNNGEKFLIRAPEFSKSYIIGIYFIVLLWWVGRQIQLVWLCSGLPVSVKTKTLWLSTWHWVCWGLFPSESSQPR